MLQLSSHIPAGAESMQPKLVTVTPELARMWLELNVRNRPLAKTRVSRYAETMRSGLWRHPTGETIIFDSDEHLIDGQHRLAAQVESGVTISYWVMFGAKPDDFTVVGQGDKRSTGDVLAIAGVAQARAVGAIARTVLRMQQFHDRHWSSVSVAQAVPARVAEFALEHAELLLQAAKWARAVKVETQIPENAYGAVAYWINQAKPNSQEWLEFHQSVRDGELLKAGSPVLTLRRWGMSRSRDKGVNQQEQVVFVTKAWNAFHDRRDIKLLRWLHSELPMPLPATPSY